MTRRVSGKCRDSSIAERVRSDFVQGIRKALMNLMQEHGYSRERAVSALLREISNGHSPDDNEVLDVMRRYGIDSKQATRALIVSSTLEQYSADRELSTLEAVQELTSKLSQAKLVQHGAEEDVVVSETAMRSQSPEIMRIPPVSMDRTRNSKTTRKSKSSKSNKPKSKEGNVKSNSNSRKRSMDESQATEQQESSSRARSDSVTEAVTAKLADSSNNPAVDDKPGPKAAVAGSPPSVRAKRARDENATTSTNNNNNKRSRPA